MEIKFLRRCNLQHLEHYQFTDHLLTMAKEANVAKLTAVLKPLEDAFKDEDEAVFPQRGNAMNAQLRELDDLEPSAAITALINRYNQLVDNRHTLLKQRETSNAKANAAKIEDQRKMLTPLFDALAKTLGVAPEALHYSGESRGSGAAKCYRLTIDGRSSGVWAKVSRKKLVQVAESEVPKAKNGGKKNGSGGDGSGNGGNGGGSGNSGSGNSGGGSGNGSGSGNPGGNKPGGSGQGSATVTPKE